MAIILNNRALITIYGGSGFIGRHVVRAIARTGARMRIAVRRPELSGFLQPLGGVGQINAVQANVRYPDSLLAAAEDADFVVNLVGILFPSGKQTFNSVMDQGARHVAEAARQAGARMLVHMSAIGAGAKAPSIYARSKAAGEAAVKEVFPDAVILRPSIVFGPEDDFFNRFAALARISPALPLIGGGKTKMQPVFAGDVAKAVIAALTGKSEAGAPYELGGPEVLTMKEVMQRVLAYTMRKRLLMQRAVLARQAPGQISANAAEADADRRPGADARDRQCREQGGEARRPYAPRPGNRAYRGRERRPRLSRAVPPARPVLGLPARAVSTQL